MRKETVKENHNKIYKRAKKFHPENTQESDYVV